MHMPFGPALDAEVSHRREELLRLSNASTARRPRRTRRLRAVRLRAAARAGW